MTDDRPRPRCRIISFAEHSRRQARFLRSGILAGLLAGSLAPFVIYREFYLALWIDFFRVLARRFHGATGEAADPGVDLVLIVFTTLPSIAVGLATGCVIGWGAHRRGLPRKKWSDHISLRKETIRGSRG